MNKQGGVLTDIITIILILLFIVGLGLTLKFYNHLECYEEIAEDFCENEGMYSGSLGPMGFKCLEDERKNKGERYKFTKEEIKRCTKS